MSRAAPQQHNCGPWLHGKSKKFIHSSAYEAAAANRLPCQQVNLSARVKYAPNETVTDTQNTAAEKLLKEFIRIPALLKLVASAETLRKCVQTLNKQAVANTEQTAQHRSLLSAHITAASTAHGKVLAAMHPLAYNASQSLVDTPTDSKLQPLHHVT